MSRERIAIVGGGIAALSAAYQLSRTPELRARYEVTLYQMGWRLGGKLASGRNPDRGYRNEEHGLHVWFGFYDNAFKLAQEVYQRWAKPHGCPFQTWRDAFEPQSYTPIGERVGAGWDFWHVRWPENSDEPGGDEVGLSFWGVVTEFVSAIEELFETLLEELGLTVVREVDYIPDAVENLLGWAFNKLGLGRSVSTELGELVTQAHHLAEAVTGDQDGDGVPDGIEAAAKSLDWVLQQFIETLREELDELQDQDLDDVENIIAALDVAVAFARGMLNDSYGILSDFNLDRLDHLDFRQWLKDNGARHDIVDHWSGIRALYDTCFQYTDGFTDQPTYAAGAAARVCIRILFTYKGAVLYLIKSGMGETMIAPLYEVCRDQGVQFRFFHKLVDMELSPDGNVLTGLKFEKQVEIKNGAQYQPLETVRGLRCWPVEPFWKQIVDGDAMRDAGVNWESHWNDWEAAGSLELSHGVDFDRCILGVAMGAFKELNSVDGSFAQAVINQKPAFKAMTKQLPLVPNCGLQLAMDRNLDELGWKSGRPAAVGWAYPMDIWADMTPVLDTEDWPPGQAPTTLHYLTGSFGSTLYKNPSTETSTPDHALNALWSQTLDQMKTVMKSIWPNGVKSNGELNWSLLHDSKGATGVNRLKAQYLRANVEPSECVVGTPAGSTRFRLDAGQTGVLNLFICGAWTRTGINASCVEGAVMSGMKAARAVSGWPKIIVGEDFLGPKAPPNPVFTAPPNPPSSPSSSSSSSSSSSGGSVSELPPYQNTLGHAQQSVMPPGIVKDARVYVFAVQIDSEAAETFVNQRLAGPTMGQVEYKVLGDILLVAFLDGAQLTSTAVQMGWLPDHECAMTLLMAEKNDAHPADDPGSDDPKLVAWMPYIFVDTSIAMCTGREIWGFPKEMSKITVPPRSGPADLFQATARVFETLDDNTEGVIQPIVTVNRKSGSDSLDAVWDTAEDALEWIVDQITDDDDELWHWDDALKLALDAAELAVHRQARITNLKQFRDAQFPDRACYQAIIHSKFHFPKVTGGGILLGDWEMTIPDVQSHQIIFDLGLSGTTNDVMFGFFVDVDFEILKGEEVWRA